METPRNCVPSVSVFFCLHLFLFVSIVPGLNSACLACDLIHQGSPICRISTSFPCGLWLLTAVYLTSCIFDKGVIEVVMIRFLSVYGTWISCDESIQGPYPSIHPFIHSSIHPSIHPSIHFYGLHINVCVYY